MILPLFYNLHFRLPGSFGFWTPGKFAFPQSGQSKIISLNTIGSLVEMSRVILSPGLGCSPQANESNNPIARGRPRFLTCLENDAHSRVACG